MVRFTFLLFYILAIDSNYTIGIPFVSKGRFCNIIKHLDDVMAAF